MTPRTFLIARRGRRFVVTVPEFPAELAEVFGDVVAMLARLEALPPIAEAAE